MSVRSYKLRYTEDPIQEGRTATGISTAIFKVGRGHCWSLFLHPSLLETTAEVVSNYCNVSLQNVRYRM